MFEEGLKQRIRKQPSQRQLYLAGLIYTPRAVDRWGQVAVDGWTYGGPETMEKLLPFHGNGQRILLGRDPDDFSAPALAYDENGRMICEDIQPIARGAYDSVDGKREAARNRKVARRATDEAEAANNYLTDAEMRARWADLPGLAAAPQADATVVEGRFGGPLNPSGSDTPDTSYDDGSNVISPEMQENQKRRIAERLTEMGRKVV